jgi:signal transduction histidine kinase
MIKKKIRLYKMVSIGALAAIVILSFGFITYFNITTAEALKESHREELRALAGAIACKVDGDEFVRILPGDESSARFIALRDSLHLIRESNPDILYLYTMRLNGTEVEFVVDDSFGFEDDAARIGEVYPLPNNDLLRGFTTLSADRDFTTDQWGTVLSGYAPILDSEGRSVGLVGVDKDAQDVLEQIGVVNTALFTILVLLVIGIAILATGFDIFRSQTETAIVRSNEKLNLLNNIVRHDILNTLTGLLGLEDMVLASDDPKQISTLLPEIKAQTRKVQEQITFTRDYQNLGLNEPVWQNLRELIQRSVGSVDFGGVSFGYECADIEIYADALLERVFYNLMDNSMRYGGNTLDYIHITCLPRDRDTVILFEDNGTGVADEFKEAIFQRKHYRHSGFGLFLSREILAITGMSIRESGVPGKGARFEIQVPRKNVRIPPNRKSG